MSARHIVAALLLCTTGCDPETAPAAKGPVESAESPQRLPRDAKLYWGDVDEAGERWLVAIPTGYHGPRLWWINVDARSVESAFEHTGWYVRDWGLSPSGKVVLRQGQTAGITHLAISTDGQIRHRLELKGQDLRLVVAEDAVIVVESDGLRKLGFDGQEISALQGTHRPSPDGRYAVEHEPESTYRRRAYYDHTGLKLHAHKGLPEGAPRKVVQFDTGEPLFTTRIAHGCRFSRDSKRLVCVEHPEGPEVTHARGKPTDTVTVREMPEGDIVFETPLGPPADELALDVRGISTSGRYVHLTDGFVYDAKRGTRVTQLPKDFVFVRDDRIAWLEGTSIMTRRIGQMPLEWAVPRETESPPEEAPKAPPESQ